MQIVYEAENIIDAHLVRGILETVGIAAFVLGEHLAGGMGELPAAGLIRVGVSNSDVAGAEAALRDWREASIVEADADDTGPLPAT